MPQTPIYTTNEVVDPIEHHDTHEGLADGSLNTPNTNLQTFRSEAFNDFIASGGLWSADNLTTNLLASMTSVVAYIGGVRILSNSVSAKSLTASKDTYIDLGDDGVIDYNEVALDATPPTLATDHIRLAVVVTDGSATVRLYDRRNLSPFTLARCVILEGTTDKIWVDSLPGRFILSVDAMLIGTGAVSTNIVFNGDTANNYARRRSVNGATDDTATGVTTLGLRGFTNNTEFNSFLIHNYISQRKMLYGMAMTDNGDAASAPTRVEFEGKWNNTSTQINRIDYNNIGAGSFSNGTQMVVAGRK